MAASHATSSTCGFQSSSSIVPTSSAAASHSTFGAGPTPAPAVAASTAAGSADADVGVEKDQPWKGFRVVFTGSIDRLNRSKAKCIAEQLGAESFPRSVSKSTDLLVSGKNGGEKGSQAEAKAQKLGVTIMTSNDFIYAATISRTCTLSWNERAKTYETEYPPYPPYNSDFYNNRNGN